MGYPKSGQKKWAKAQFLKTKTGHIMGYQKTILISGIP
jgi:hypothetical protein